jgi:hypothetical protein
MAGSILRDFKYGIFRKKKFDQIFTINLINAQISDKINIYSMDGTDRSGSM